MAQRRKTQKYMHRSKGKGNSKRKYAKAQHDAKAHVVQVHVHGFPVYKAEMIEFLKRALSFKTEVICLNESQSIFPIQ